MAALSRVTRCFVFAAASLACSCSQFVQYTDELSDHRTGRSPFVTSPAQLGGSAGFLIGIPVDIVALPITYPIYAYQRNNEPIAADPLSTMLFPSFVLWRAGTMLGAPFDLLEFVVYRGWRQERTLTREERERIEVEYDEQALPSYPVEPIYPDDEWRARAATQR